MNLNKDEYGQTVYADLGQDISTATSYTFVIEPQYGEKLEKTGVLGTSNVTVNDEDLLANQYLTYVVQDGDLPASGQIRVKGEANYLTSKVIGDYKTITVLP